jgi:DivIVA domain-containing protein
VRTIEARRQPRNAPTRAHRTRVPDAEIAALRNVRFSAARRGYDRDEVDRYMNRVNQLLAELQFTSTPESAIRGALASISEESEGVLERAHREAEEITHRSRSRADDRIQEAKQEAQKLREAAEQEARQLREAAEQEAHGSHAAAESRIRGLEADVKAMMEKRDRTIVELVELSRRLDELLKRNGSNGDRASAPEPEPARAER